MKKTLIIITLLSLIMIISVTAEITRKDTSILYGDANLNLKITPENTTCLNGVCEQEFQVCNNYPVEGYFFAGFEFNQPLKKADAFLQSSYDVLKSRPVYEIQEVTYTCPEFIEYTEDTATCFYHDDVNNTDVTTKTITGYNRIEENTIYYNDLVQTSSENYYETITNWNNINTYFTILKQPESVKYHTKQGKKILPGDCTTFKIIYEPYTNTGKWNAWLYVDTVNDWTCILDGSCFRSVFIDPTWNMSAWNKYDNCKSWNITETDGINRIMMVVNHNLTDLILNNNATEIRIVNDECFENGIEIPYSLIETDDETYAYVSYYVNVTASSTTTYSVYYNNNTPVENPLPYNPSPMQFEANFSSANTWNQSKPNLFTFSKTLSQQAGYIYLDNNVMIYFFEDNYLYTKHSNQYIIDVRALFADVDTTSDYMLMQMGNDSNYQTWDGTFDDGLEFAQKLWSVNNNYISKWNGGSGSELVNGNFFDTQNKVHINFTFDEDKILRLSADTNNSISYDDSATPINLNFDMVKIYGRRPNARFYEVRYSTGNLYGVNIGDNNLSISALGGVQNLTNNQPVVDITSPLDLSSVENTTSIFWTVVNEDTDYFTSITLNGSVIASNLSSGISSYDINFRLYTNGWYEINVTACENNTAELYCGSDVVNVLVDNTFYCGNIVDNDTSTFSQSIYVNSLFDHNYSILSNVDRVYWLVNDSTGVLLNLPADCFNVSGEVVLRVSHDITTNTTVWSCFNTTEYKTLREQADTSKVYESQIIQTQDETTQIQEYDSITLGTIFYTITFIVVIVGFIALLIMTGVRRK